MVKAGFFTNKNLWICTIIALAFFIRTYNLPNLTTFSGEEGKDFLIVRKIVTEKNLTLLGPMIGPYNSQNQVFLGPAYYYLILLPLFIFNWYPTGPAYFIAALSTISIYFVYLVGKKLFNKDIGLISGALWGFSPLLVEQGRSSNPAYFIPILSSILFFSFAKIIADKKTNYLILTAICLGLLIQFHLTTIVTFFMVILLILIFKVKVSLKTYLTSTTAFVLTISPMILFEIRNKFYLTNTIIGQLSYSENYQDSPGLLSYVFSSPQKLTSILFGQSLMMSAILLVITILLIVKTIFKNKKTEYKVISFLSIWFIANIIFVSLYSGPFIPHYFGTSLIPLVILIVASLYHFKPRIIGAAILFLILSMSILSLEFEKNHGFSMPEGWNLKGVDKASKIISQDVSYASFNVAATLDGDVRARPYRYFLDLDNKTPLGVESYPDSDVLYLISRDSKDQISSYQVWEVSSFRPFNVTLLSDVQNGIKVYKLTKQK